MCTSCFLTKRLNRSHQCYQRALWRKRRHLPTLTPVALKHVEWGSTTDIWRPQCRRTLVAWPPPPPAVVVAAAAVVAAVAVVLLSLCHTWVNSLFQLSIVITARCTRPIVQSAVLRSHVVRPSVCLSVTLAYCDHIVWKYWKLIARTISPTPSLFVAQRPSTYSQGNMGKFWGV